MRHDESQLLVQTAKNTVQLFQDRDDMLVGITATLLDLYRVGFQHGQQDEGGGSRASANAERFSGEE